MEVGRGISFWNEWSFFRSFLGDIRSFSAVYHGDRGESTPSLAPRICRVALRWFSSHLGTNWRWRKQQGITTSVPLRRDGRTWTDNGWKTSSVFIHIWLYICTIISIYVYVCVFEKWTRLYILSWILYRCIWAFGEMSWRVCADFVGAKLMALKCQTDPGQGSHQRKNRAGRKGNMIFFRELDLEDGQIWSMVNKNIPAVKVDGTS